MTPLGKQAGHGCPISVLRSLEEVMTHIVKVKFTDNRQAIDYQDQHVKTNPVKPDEVPALCNGNCGVARST